MKIEKYSFGVIPKHTEGVNDKYAGQEISNFRLIADNGMSVVISEFGAVIKEINVADKEGKYENVLLSYDDLEGFLGNDPCFGAPIGRVANRIGGAFFVLNGKKYDLPKNDGENNLHSCTADNYFRRPYKTVEYGADEKEAFVKLYLESPNMDQGYPGNLDLYITYTLDNEGRLGVTYTAKSDADTLFNMTNHAYINLGGNTAGDARECYLMIDSDKVTEADPAKIPTGKLFDVEGTPFDFRKEKQVIKDFYAVHPMLEKGYDCNYVLKNNGTVSLAAVLRDEKSGRSLEVYTDLPGIQFYSGNYIDKKGAKGMEYKDFHGLCLETQQFPDAINHPDFPSPVIKAGEEYKTTTIYKFSV
jgi:aldose 1-epimerase